MGVSSRDYATFILASLRIFGGMTLSGLFVTYIIAFCFNPKCPNKTLLIISHVAGKYALSENQE